MCDCKVPGTGSEIRELLAIEPVVHVSIQINIYVNNQNKIRPNY